jgi:hypothetical protein
MLPAEAAVLAEFQLLRRRLLVFRGCIVALLALGTRKSDDISHYLSPFKMPLDGIQSIIQR